MSTESVPAAGRRERNKQEKLGRIIAAASALFAKNGVDDVTTQQIADAADIGAGTLFLYAKTKGELLLLVQNAHYADALERGREAAARETGSVVDAVMALVRPIVECNRVQVENGRSYLREMVFGDPEEPRHAEALAIVAETEAAIAGILRRDDMTSAEDAPAIARAVSAVLLLSMGSGANATASVEEILVEVRGQLRAMLSR